MILEKTTYDQAKVDALASKLRQDCENGQPRWFEVLVDNIPVVGKTQDLDRFADWPDAITSRSRSVTIKIYQGESNRNDKWVFSFHHPAPVRTGLPGPMELGGLHEPNPTAGTALAGSLEGHISAALAGERTKWELGALSATNKRLRKKLKKVKAKAKRQEAELLHELEAAAENNGTFAGLDINKVIAGLFHSVAARNPNAIKRLPGGEMLSGIFADPATPEAPAGAQGEASFQPAGDAIPEPASTEDQAALDFVRELRTKFDESQRTQVLVLLDRLSEHPSLVFSTLEYVTNKMP